LMKGVVICEKF